MPTPTKTLDVEATLRRVFHRIVADLVMMTGKPVRLIWDPSVKTAATDCVAEVRLAPWFFLEGLDSVGYGTSYHEGGHMVYTPKGTELLERANRDGGPHLQSLVNIIVDRRDDMRNAKDNPGFADTLRRRLLVICTMSRQPDFSARFPDVDKETFLNLLHHLPARDLWEDFFFSAKWHKRPHFKQTFKAMKYCTRKRLWNANNAELLWIAQKVYSILGDPQQKDTNQSSGSEASWEGLVTIATASHIEQGGKISPEVSQLLHKIATQYTAHISAGGMNQLRSLLAKAEMRHPGPISVGVVERVPVTEVRNDPAHRNAYDSLLADIAYLVDPLVTDLRRLESPSEYTLYAQDEGDELDFDEVGAIATGLPGHWQETTIERDVDAEIHLAIDASGSMYGHKLHIAKSIGTLFTESMLSLEEGVDGHMWSFDSEGINDFGNVARESGFVALESRGGNSDTHLLTIVGEHLARSKRKQRVMILLCDDGPDNIEMARRLSHELLARGVIVVHIMIGVHGLPNIYPIELLFQTMEQCLSEFGELLKAIISHAK
jgi:hypothetical protein